MNINRSPDAGESNGAASNGTTGEGAAAGSEGAPQYVDRQTFDSFRQELSQQFARLTPQERREERNESRESKAPTRPSLKDFDFKNDATAWDRYNDALSDFNYSRWEEKQTSANAERETQATIQRNEQNHFQREKEYAEKHPEFAVEKKAAGPIMVAEEVKRSIFRSPASPEILHYMIQNPGTDAELNQILKTEGKEALLERLGEIKASMKRDSNQADSNRRAGGTKLPNQRFSGNSATTKPKMSKAQMFEDFNS